MVKLKKKFKLFFCIELFIIFLILSLKSYSDNSLNIKSGVVIGSSEALVKIKVFSSLTCPHCANFHIKVIPEIKKRYVDSGKVQIILIDFPLDQASFNASKLLHCLDEKNQINYLDTIYKTQSKWATGSNLDDINKNLKKVVRDMGISSKKFEKCISDEVISDKILNGRIEANRKYSIDSTPTIIINEKKLKGSANFKNIKNTIEKII